MPQAGRSAGSIIPDQKDQVQCPAMKVQVSGELPMEVCVQNLHCTVFSGKKNGVFPLVLGRGMPLRLRQGRQLIKMMLSLHRHCLPQALQQRGGNVFNMKELLFFHVKRRWTPRVIAIVEIKMQVRAEKQYADMLTGRHHGPDCLLTAVYNQIQHRATGRITMQNRAGMALAERGSPGQIAELHEDTLNRTACCGSWQGGALLGKMIRSSLVHGA